MAFRLPLGNRKVYKGVLLHYIMKTYKDFNTRQKLVYNEIRDFITKLNRKEQIETIELLILAMGGLYK